MFVTEKERYERKVQAPELKKIAQKKLQNARKHAGIRAVSSLKAGKGLFFFATYSVKLGRKTVKYLTYIHKLIKKIRPCFARF